MAVIASITAAFRALVSSAHGSPFGSETIPQTVDGSVDFGSGTASGFADVVWTDARALAATTGETIDILSVDVAGIFGGQTFAKVKAVIVHNTGSYTLVFGPDAAGNGWYGAASMFIAAPPAAPSSTINIPAGGVLLWACPAGLAPGAGATDDIYIYNTGAAACTYEIGLLGSSS